MKGKEKSDVQERLAATSRREMMQLTAASVGLLSLMLPPSAEAAARNATMRQKIMEKFEELRRKAGLSKPKEDEGEDKKPKDEKEGKSKAESSTEESKPNAKAEGEEKKAIDKNQGKAHGEKDVKEGVVIPALPGIINGATVEITLP